MDKSVFTDPAPGDRLIRRLANEIDREILSLKEHYDEASRTKDPKLVKQVNDAILRIEKSANQLRTAEATPTLEDRLQSAISVADSALSSFAALEATAPDTPVPIPPENEPNEPPDHSASGNESPPKIVDEVPAPDGSHRALSLATRSHAEKSSLSSLSRHLDAAKASQAARKEHLKNRQELEAAKDKLAVELKRREFAQLQAENERKEQERKLQALQLEIDAAEQMEEARLADERESLSGGSSDHGREKRIAEWVDSVSNLAASQIGISPAPSQRGGPVMTTTVQSSLTPHAQPFQPTSVNPYAFTPTPIYTTSAPASLGHRYSPVSCPTAFAPFAPISPQIHSAPANLAHQSFAPVATLTQFASATGTSFAPATTTNRFAPAVGPLSFAPAVTMPQSAPAVGSMSFAPAVTMPQSAPAVGPMSFAPAMTAPFSAPAAGTLFAPVATVPTPAPTATGVMSFATAVTAPQPTPTGSAPWIAPASIAPATVSPALPPGLPNSPTGLFSGDVATSLLTVNLMSHSHDLMVQGRPPKEKKFSGSGNPDFETFWNQFQTVTKLEGITDHMRFLELKHWVSGMAGIVVSQYENESDHTEALKKVKLHLQKEFGRKLSTARQLLDDLLSGPKLNPTDATGIQSFILKLECVYKRAVETNRATTFSTQETYHEILRKKLPFFIEKYAPIQTDNEEKQAGLADSAKHQEVSFSTFINYLRRSNKICITKAQIRKTDAVSSNSTPTNGNNNNAKKTSKVTATSVKIAATDASAVGSTTAPTVNADIAVTTTSRPKKKTVGGRPPQKPSYAAAAGAVPSSKPFHGNTKKSDFKTDSGGKHVRPECLACEKGRHDLDYCREFRKKSDKDKRQFALTQGICFNCLVKGHMSSSCTEDPKCSKCKGKHHSILHEEHDTKNKTNEQ